MFVYVDSLILSMVLLCLSLFSTHTHRRRKKTFDDYICFFFSFSLTKKIVKSNNCFYRKDLSRRGQDRIVSVFIMEIRSSFSHRNNALHSLPIADFKSNFFFSKWRMKFSFQLSLMTHYCLDWTMKQKKRSKKPRKLYAWQPTYTRYLSCSLIFVCPSQQ
jgi:hypothetical protein